MTIFKKPSVKFAERGEYLFKEQEEPGFPGLSITVRRQLRFTSCHVRQRKLQLYRVLQEGSTIQQLQQIGEQENMKNRMSIKALIHCTYFLVCHHILHMTNFDPLVDLIVSCDAEELRKFLERIGKNASYMFKIHTCQLDVSKLQDICSKKWDFIDKSRPKPFF